MYQAGKNTTWRSLKKITLSLLQVESVKNNLKRIDVQLTKKLIYPMLPKSLKPIIYNKKYKSFRILVLGRINPPKGETTRKLMEQLNNNFNLFFEGP